MRLERQIAELKGLEGESGKPLGAREKKQLEDAERDLARVKKARETVGAAGGGRGGGRSGGVGGRDGERGGGGGGGGLGKRRRDSTWAEESEDTDESVRRIPMPRDTPPPIPRPVRNHNHNLPVPTTTSSNNNNDKPSSSSLTNANLEPLGQSTRVIPQPHPHSHSPSPSTETNNKPVLPKTVYESKPVVRDLRKEAVEKFVPVAVQRKLDARRGEGGRLLEEEEMSRLEEEGYGVGGRRMKDEVEKEEGKGNVSMEDGGMADENKMGQDERGERNLRDEEVRRWSEEDARRLREEEERFERELAMDDEDS